MVDTFRRYVSRVMCGKLEMFTQCVWRYHCWHLDKGVVALGCPRSSWFFLSWYANAQSIHLWLLERWVQLALRRHLAAIREHSIFGPVKRSWQSNQLLPSIWPDLFLHRLAWVVSWRTFRISHEHPHVWCSKRLTQCGTLCHVPVDTTSFLRCAPAMVGACWAFLRSNHSYSSLGVLIEFGRWLTCWLYCWIVRCWHWVRYDGAGAILSYCWEGSSFDFTVWPSWSVKVAERYSSRVSLVVVVVSIMMALRTLSLLRFWLLPHLFGVLTLSGNRLVSCGWCIHWFPYSFADGHVHNLVNAFVTWQKKDESGDTVCSLGRRLGGTFCWLVQPVECYRIHASAFLSGCWSRWSTSWLLECIWYLRHWFKRQRQVKFVRYTGIWQKWCLLKLAGGSYRHSRQMSRVPVEAPTTAADVFKMGLKCLKNLGKQRELLAGVDWLHSSIPSFQAHDESFERQLSVHPAALESVRPQVTRLKASLGVVNRQLSTSQPAVTAVGAEHDPKRPLIGAKMQKCQDLEALYPEKQRCHDDHSWLLLSFYEMRLHDLNRAFMGYLRPLLDSVYERTVGFHSVSTSQVERHSKTLRQSASSIFSYLDRCLSPSPAVCNSGLTTFRPVCPCSPPSSWLVRFRIVFEALQ